MNNENGDLKYREIMLEQTKNFLDDKNITNKAVREIVTLFIIKHTQLYGDVIPFEILMERLKSNLNSITLKDPSTKPAKFNSQAVVGTYEGFDKNSIVLYFSESDLANQQIAEGLVDILLHELTHAAYTIKQNNQIGAINFEKQVFTSFVKYPDGVVESRGEDAYIEPIVNYVSSRILGKKNGAYIAETANIRKLANKTNEKELILSAFNSDEEKFKKCFASFPEGSYEYFTKGMKSLNIGNSYGYKHGSSIMENFFDGVVPKPGEKRILKELISRRSELTQPTDLTQ